MKLICPSVCSQIQFTKFKELATNDLYILLLKLYILNMYKA